MPLVLFRQVAPGIAFVHSLEGPVDPGFGLGGGSIDNTLPGGGFDHIWGGVGGRPNRPDQGLPGSGYPSNGLPGSPGHPDNRPPATKPPVVAPGMTLVMVRDPVGVWHYATVDASTPPPKPVPVPPPNTIDNTLPPTAAPKA